MNLPQFLTKIDSVMENVSLEELKKFVHETARTWPESKRKEFLETLESFTGGSTDAGSNFEYQQGKLGKELKEISGKLADINEGTCCLDSEYNEEWDDWYNSDEDEILFQDPQGLLKYINRAMQLIHDCVDQELFTEGCELAEMLMILEVTVEGDYSDYDGSPLYICDLEEYGLLEGDYINFVKDCLYLIYMGNKQEHRAEEVLNAINNLRADEVSLEDILQSGKGDLPEFPEFLHSWIAYLGKQHGKKAESLLLESQLMLQDEEKMLENARKFAAVHPVLYLQLLEQKSRFQDAEAMLKIGQEALGAIPIDMVVRSDIALTTAEYAVRCGKQKEAEHCWLEAFRSHTTIQNYLRIRFQAESWTEYSDEVTAIYEQLYRNRHGKDKLYGSEYSGQKNTIDRTDYCTLLVFDGQFEKMRTSGMTEKNALGWSATYMKEGLAFMMLTLFQGNDFSLGMKAMQSRILSVCGLTAEKYYFGTGKRAGESDAVLFEKIIGMWKESMTLSADDRKKWLNRIDKWIVLRVKGIMENNRRNYYGECAAFIAAFGEVQESLGIYGAKAAVMEKYRSEYSRRSAFISELKVYGMTLKKKG